MTLETLVPVITALGFAVQQFLQALVDPLISMAISARKAKKPVTSGGTQALFWQLPEEDLKRALLGIVSIIMGLLIASFATDMRVLTAANETLGLKPANAPKSWDLFITALTISVGAEGANSVTKLAQYLKGAVKAKNPLSGAQNPFFPQLPAHPHSSQPSANPLLSQPPANSLLAAPPAANFNRFRPLDVATSERRLDLQARAKEEEYDA